MAPDNTALDPFTRTVAEGKNPTAFYSLRHLYNAECTSMRGDPESRADHESQPFIHGFNRFAQDQCFKKNRKNSLVATAISSLLLLAVSLSQYMNMLS